MTTYKGGGLARRDLLAAGLALSGATGVVLSAGAARAEVPGDRLHTLVRLKGGLTDRVAVSTLTGRYYGVVGSEMKPLFGLLAAVFARHRPRPDGGYDVFSVEQAYFTDLNTGQVLDQWLNPYTGETVSVPPTRGVPTRLIITPEPRLVVPVPPGVAFDNSVTGPTRVVDDVWMVEQTLVSVNIPGQGKPFHYSEINGYQCSAADLARPDHDRLKVRTTYESVVDWRPWMKMGDHPGHLMGTGHGGAVVPVDLLPPVWLEATRRQRPELITAPESVLAPLWDAKA